MAAGFEVYDASGVLSFSSTDRLARVLGTIQIAVGAGNGSLTDANLVNGAGFASFFTSAQGYFQPAVAIAGNTISWTYSGGNSSNRAGGYIVYGIF